MTSLVPIWTLDFLGNIAIIALSFYLLFKIDRIMKLRLRRPLWMYLQWQVIALTVFSFSHSIGHIVRRVMILMDHRATWDKISPYTGSINSISFVVVGILAFLYKDIESASEKIGTLEEAKKELEATAGKLLASQRKMAEDAEEITLKNRELTALNRIAMTAGRSLELDKVLSSIIKEVRAFLDAEFFCIYLVEQGNIVIKTCEGLSEEFSGKTRSRSVEEPWLKREVMEGRPFFARERIDEHAGKVGPDIKAEGVQAWAAVPLMSKGKVVGVLAAGSTRYDGIDERQLDTLSTIGGYAGIVIDNAMLYEESRQKVDDLERFRKFSVGREMRIIELKEKVADMERKEK
ncbi:MAG: GAF domain-containing protein [Nitrospirae bacterium]|nr:GAF domain-containing protein [Nitrospirota bacterium]